MEFEGVVYKIMPATKGTSARGDWQRQEVIFELPQEFSRKICVIFFNKESDVARLREGMTCTVSVNIESREFNGKWYTDVRAFNVSIMQRVDVVQEMPMPQPQPSYTAAQPTQGDFFTENADDLPF